MSDLSSFLKEVGSFFASFTHSDPAVQTSVNSVGTSLLNIGSEVEAILPHLADDAVNAALALIPGGYGNMAAPVADSFINAVIAGLEAKLSSAVKPAA